MTKKILAVLLCLIMIFTMIPIATFAAGESAQGAGNIVYSQNAGILAVSANSPNGEDASKAFDGNTTDTKWCVTRDTGWVAFSLNAAVKPDLLVVHHAGGSSNDGDRKKAGITTKYALQVLKNEQEYLNNPSNAYLSNDGNWMNVAQETNNTLKIATETKILQSQNRKIYRFKVDDAGKDNCIRVYEIQLFKKRTNLAEGAKVLGVFSESPNANESASKAFDGNMNATKWSVKNKNEDGWVVFDIGTKSNIKELKIYNAGFGGEDINFNTTAYKLQILDESKCTEEAFLKKSQDEKNKIMNDITMWKSASMIFSNGDNISRSAVLMDDARRIFRFRVMKEGASDGNIRIYEIALFDKANLPIPEAERYVSFGGSATYIHVDGGLAAHGEWTSTNAAMPGLKLKLTAHQPPVGTEFVRWEVTGGDVLLEDPYSPVTYFVLPEDDVYIKAIFKRTHAKKIEMTTKTVTDRDYLYFGNYKNKDIKWQILDADKDNTQSEGGMFLLSEYILEKDNLPFDKDGVANTGQTKPNEWQNSDAQAWCREFVNSSSLSEIEKSSLKSMNKTDYETGIFDYSWGASRLSDDKVFYLSVEEVADYLSYTAGESLKAMTTDGAFGHWWLRSPYLYTPTLAGIVYDEGNVEAGNSVTFTNVGARPACNLNLQQVVFTSAAVGGKSSGDVGIGALKAVEEYTCDGRREWKVTLKDPSRKDFNAVIEDETSAKRGEDYSEWSVDVKYQNAKTGENEYVSAVLCNEKGNILYYGNIAKNSASGTQKVNIPSGLKIGKYTLRVFSEQLNGDRKTDYAGEFKDIALEVTLPRAKKPNAVFSATDVNQGTLTGVNSNMKYSVDGGKTWTDVNSTEVNIENVTPKNGIQVQAKGDGTSTVDSDIQIITLTQAAAPTGLTKTDCTTVANNNGKISGVNGTMEYRVAASDGKWTAVSGNEITGLSDLVYDIRVKANGTVLASKSVSMEILTYVPEYSITVENGTASASTAVEGTIITLTADTPPAGMLFIKWEVVSGNIQLTDANAAVTQFSMPDENVKVNAIIAPPAAKNTVTPISATFDANAKKGIDFSLTSTAESILPTSLLNSVTWKKTDGTEVTLKSNEYSTRWGNSVVLEKSFLLGQAPGSYTVTFNMDNGNSPEATVTIPETYKITLCVTPKNSGTINIAHTPFEEAVYYVLKGDSVSFDASPKEGNVFVCWKLDENKVTADKTYSFVPQGDCSLKAVFEAERCELEVTPESYDFGTVIIGDTQLEPKTFTVKNTGNTALNLKSLPTVEYYTGQFSKTILAPGESAELTISPNTNLKEGIYQKSILITGENLDSSTGGIAHTAEISVDIVFELASLHSITVENGTSSAAEAIKDTEITLTADTAPEGKIFDKWEIIKGNVVPADENAEVTTFMMPDEDVSVKAVYKDVSVPPESEPEEPDTPKTGDESHMIILFITALTSLSILSGIMFFRKKKNSVK